MAIITTINSKRKVRQEVLSLIGRIDYLNGKGESYDHTDYYEGEEKRFIKDIEDELTWDVDITVTLYPDARGNTVSINAIKGMRHQPKAVMIGDEISLVRL